METSWVANMVASSSVFPMEFLKRICQSNAALWISQYAVALSVFGDSATFAGGLLLAVDAAQRERDFGDARKLASFAEGNPNILIVVDKRPIEKPDDPQLFFIHRSSVKALIGCVLLSIGFFLLLLARISEICKSNQGAG